MGSNAPIHFNYGASSVSTTYYLWKLASTGAYQGKLSGDTGGGADGELQFDGDLVELGFFDTDPGTGITPLTDSDISNPGANLFQGTWTPLTSKTQVGQDVSDSSSVGDGEFFHKTRFIDQTSKVLSEDGTANTQYDISDADYKITNDQIGTWSSGNDTSARVAALNSATNALIGIRFYDNSNPSNGVRYNTIMNESWLWLGKGTSTYTNNDDYLIHQSDGSLTSGLTFEFDNTDYGSLSKVGTNDLSVDESTHASSTLSSSTADFVSTVTYYDGSSGFTATGSHVFSGLSGTGNIILGDDGSDVYTLHANAGNAYTFSGNLYDSIGAGAASTIIKTGSGEQIITGQMRTGSHSSSGLVIQDGKITIASSGGNVGLMKITSGSGGTPVLELNNTSSGASNLVHIGLSQTHSADYGGSIVLNGSGSETNMSVSYSSTSGSFSSQDHNRTQTFSGVISSSASNKLVKNGGGELELSGNNTFTGGVEIEDGTLIAGHANALGGTNAVTITKGKFEVDSGVTLAGSATITAGNTEKTMIGGRGDLNNDITVGSADGQIDVISPGDGISSSLTNSSSKQQVSFGDRGNAIGTFTVSDTLTLGSGGVYDWEITDFSGTASNTGAGSNWDLLKFDTLNFDSTTSDVFTINIMSLDANGDAGAMSGGNVWQDYTSNGFLFMKATGAGSGWTGTGSMGSSGLVSAFDVNTSNWTYHNHHLNNWNVWYDGGGSFYLQYSVAPEPSTYVMVTGLMLVPGMNAVRKYRNRKKKQGVEEPEEEIRS
jgi:autotransporter-associated beta strand protein